MLSQSPRDRVRSYWAAPFGVAGHLRRSRWRDIFIDIEDRMKQRNRYDI